MEVGFRGRHATRCEHIIPCATKYQSHRFSSWLLLASSIISLGAALMIHSRDPNLYPPLMHHLVPIQAAVEPRIGIRVSSTIQNSMFTTRMLTNHLAQSQFPQNRQDCRPVHIKLPNQLSCVYTLSGVWDNPSSLVSSSYQHKKHPPPGSPHYLSSTPNHYTIHARHVNPSDKPTCLITREMSHIERIN
jgi:hypothetical protein